MARSFSIYTDIDIDPDDLEEAGWHHEDECPANGNRFGATDLEQWQAAAEALHEAAHPNEPLDMRLCREEPCRTLHTERASVVKLIRRVA